MGNYASHERRDTAASLTSLGGGLSQQRTNGKSVWGTLLAPMLPMFLQNNPLPNGLPWSTMDLSTNYYKDYPHTGVIRAYNFTVTRGTIAPDGYEISGLLINDQFPAPKIEANWGDTIQVTLNNEITGPEEGAALHWHGFLHTRRGWEDGVPAISQCPVAPGKSFTYTFVAELYGSSWYHSHYSAQYAGGLYGPIVIHGPCTKDYDIDVGPVMLGDWYHASYYKNVEAIMAPFGKFLKSANNLINGKGNFDCSTVAPGDNTPCHNNAGVAKFSFKRGKTHRLRLINTSAEAMQRVSIDGHNMTVIAHDFVPVEPYQTNVVLLGVGQRADVVVKADGELDSYWLRANISVPCSAANQPNANAAIFYDGADENKEPQSTPWDIPDPGTCGNDMTLGRPAMKLVLPEADNVYTMDANFYQNSTGNNLFQLDKVDYRGNYNSPTLLLSNARNLTFDKQWNVRNTGNSKSVRVIINNRTPIPHPMHLHGFNMYILHEGPGEWDGTIMNPQNPQRRDTAVVQGSGHLVMQFDAAGNPGVWPLHCHIAWHVSAGFLVQFLTVPDEVARYRIPNVVAETCRQWGKWTKTNIPDQIDSGL